MAGYLYTLGLSLRDLQEALYFLLGSVLSGTAVNQVTIRVQERMNKQQQEAITATPPILIVDGVWVSIQYTLDSFKLDRAGHQRQCRQAQERVILVAMAVWPDGAYHTKLVVSPYSLWSCFVILPSMIAYLWRKLSDTNRFTFYGEIQCQVLTLTPSSWPTVSPALTS